MFVPKITFEAEKTFSIIESKLDLLQEHKVNHENWTNYDSIPRVGVKVAHDGRNLFLQFKVKENEILAKAKGNNSEVWTDSCVEFFISFEGSDYYYNLEMSCIGEILLSYRKSKTEDVIHAPDEIINAIIRLSSLGRENFELKQGDFEWTLLVVVPVTTFWKSDLSSFDGVKGKVNVYKCGDNLTNPHFLSWAPIDLETPNFHTPEFFGNITFDK